jgi:small-conductance mechanosensitive channel
MMKALRTILGIYLLVLFCAAPCLIAGGEIPGFLPEGGFPPGNLNGKERPEKSRGEISGLITATSEWYAKSVPETKKQNHRALRLCAALFLVMFLFSLQRLVIYITKNSFCRIFNFLRCLAASLVLSGHAPPLSML